MLGQLVYDVGSSKWKCLSGECLGDVGLCAFVFLALLCHFVCLEGSCKVISYIIQYIIHIIHL